MSLFLLKLGKGLILFCTKECWYLSFLVDKSKGKATSLKTYFVSNGKMTLKGDSSDSRWPEVLRRPMRQNTKSPKNPFCKSNFSMKFCNRPLAYLVVEKVIGLLKRFKIIAGGYYEGVSTLPPEFTPGSWLGELCTNGYPKLLALQMKETDELSRKFWRYKLKNFCNSDQQQGYISMTTPL